MISIITRIQIEANNTVSFLNGTNYVQGMSQIMPQVPTYISYGYDSISITQDGSKPFQFSVYTVTDVGGNSFAALTFQDPATTVQAKTIEIYRLLVTSVFKGCCECGNTEPECSIQYTAGTDSSILGTLRIGGASIGINYFTANNQDFTGFWPIVQDGSWIFVFSKTDPTVYGVYQLSNYTDGGDYAQFDYTLLAGPSDFPDGTSLCVDVTSVGGSLVQGWQDTLDINSTLDKNNTVDGGGFDFIFDNNNSFTINSVGGSIQTSVSGSSLLSGALSVDVAPGYIDVITPSYAAAGTGWVLAKTAAGHIEYVEAGTGTISSIGLFMPPAFTVSTPNPLITDGDFTVTGAGTALQYINGLGELATVPVYTVENGLHTKESPADPNVFHLGGQLIEGTIIDTNQIINATTNNEWQLSIRANRTTVNNGQDTLFPLGVANLGNGGVATFQDYGDGNRPNPSVEVVGDVDLYQPLLELRMDGNLPNLTPVLTDRISLLRLKYDGDPVNNRIAMDFSFRNTNPNPNLDSFPAVQWTAETTNVTDGAETANLELMMFQGGSQQVKLIMEGKGQLTLNEYGPTGFSDATTNINNALTYVLGVDNTGKVWKKLATGGGTVQSVGVSAGTGISASVANPTTTPVISITNTAPDQIVALNTTGTGLAVTGTYPNFTLQNTLPDQIVSLTPGTNVTITGTYPNFTINASGGGPGTTYDSSQGIYKDTSLANDTFQLGAPSGSQAGIAFSIDRYIDTTDQFLQIEGANGEDGSVVLKVIEGSGIPLDTKASFISATNYKKYAGSFTGHFSSALLAYSTAADGNTLEVTNVGANGLAAIFQSDNGSGIQIISLLENQFQINGGSSITPAIYPILDLENLSNLISPANGEGISITMSPGVDAFGTIDVGVSLNAVISDIGTIVGNDSVVDFRVDTLNLGTVQQHTSFIGSGQLQLHEYGQTPANFPDTPVWALGVDASGNVVEFTPSGGGTTYTVNNGLTENPANNFQLGGPLVLSTTIDGVATYDLSFTNIKELTGSAESVYFEGSDGVNTSSLVLAPSKAALEFSDGTTGTSSVLELGNAYSRFYHVDGTTLSASAIELTGTELRVQTPLYTSRTAGDVLTLLDPLTGESEWSTPTGGGSGLEAILMLMGS